MKEVVAEKHLKAGRPLKTVKRDIRAAVRFSKTEYFIVQTKAGKAGLKVSAYIREVAINKEVKSRLSEKDRQTARELAGFSNNANQVAKVAHKEGMLSAMQCFETIKAAIDELLNRFHHA